MSKPKLLILGATGFIGRNLTEHFLKTGGYEIFAHRHRQEAPEALAEVPGLQWIQADLTDAAAVRAAVAGKDIVLQAAAVTSGAKDIIERPYIHVADNAVMNALLFEACHEAKVKRVVFFSCTVMYPSSKTPVKEEDFTGQIEKPYFAGGWTKVYNEKMCEFYAGLGNTHFTVLRHSNIYGPHDKYDLEKSHVFGATVAKVMTAETSKVTVWGDGSDERDFLYADDLCEAVALILQKSKASFELLNVGLGQSCSVTELVKQIIQASGRKLEIEYHQAQPSIGFKLCLNTGLIRKRYGWAPKTPLAEGIRKTLDWYREEQMPDAGDAG